MFISTPICARNLYMPSSWNELNSSTYQSYVPVATDQAKLSPILPPSATFIPASRMIL